MIKTITLTNFLSYGPAPNPIELSALNVIIGPNGSGKSNLIEALELLHATPKDLLTPIRDGGGVRDWLWKGTARPPIAEINAVIDNPKGSQPLRYVLRFTEVGQRFEIVDERVERMQRRIPATTNPICTTGTRTGVACSTTSRATSATCSAKTSTQPPRSWPSAKTPTNIPS